MSEDIKVSISFGYGGRIKISCTIGKVEYAIEKEYLCALLETMIQEKGFETKKTSEQKYPRLIINQ